jgi:hypothetical protein
MVAPPAGHRRLDRGSLVAHVSLLGYSGA